VGKSTLCWDLRQDVADFCQSEIGFLYADLFSHLTFPWAATDRQLDIKYRGIQAALGVVTLEHPVLMIEDTFRRQEDIDFLYGMFATLAVPLTTILLTANLQTLLIRNRSRVPPYRVADQKIVELATCHRTLNWCEAKIIDAEEPPEILRRRTFHEILPDLERFVGR
jgi:hypothetical protein